MKRLFTRRGLFSAIGLGGTAFWVGAKSWPTAAAVDALPQGEKPDEPQCSNTERERSGDILTGIAYMTLRVSDFQACRSLYGGGLGLKEITQGKDTNGRSVCLFAVGPSFLELREDPAVVTGILPSGKARDSVDVPGSVRHLSFLVTDNNEAFAALRKGNLPLSTAKGPELQDIDHAYMQRTLLELRDPNGYVMQISEVVDPREHLEKRRAEKNEFLSSYREQGLLRGFDHLNIGCTDIRATRELFGQKLGLEEISHRVSESGKIEEDVFAVGSTDLELWGNRAQPQPAFGPGIVGGLGFWTDNVERAYQRLKEQGVAVGHPPADRATLPGVRRRSFFFEGLDGLPLEIAQRL
jgi:catechol 2,3-dioxygenase-like lactoylglutathione lyase family enzyme